MTEPGRALSSDTDEALKAHLFPHEYDLIGNLRRFPLVVRYRLDRMQLQMSLGTWQQLGFEHRLRLACAPFSTLAEQQTLATALQAEVLKLQGTALKTLPPEPIADYRQHQRVPEEIASALAGLKLAITLAQWQALPELARFGLAKLSRHGHDNRRLGPLIDDLLYAPGDNGLPPG